MEKTIDPFSLDTVTIARAKVAELGSLSFVAIALETLVGNYLTVLLSANSGLDSEKQSRAMIALSEFLAALTQSVQKKSHSVAVAQVVQNVKQLAPNVRHVNLGDYLNPKEYK